MWEIWYESILRGADYPNVVLHAMKPNIGEVWYVISVRKGLPFIHEEIVPEKNTISKSHPYCIECGYYLSTWAPCGHIASVFSRKTKNLKALKNIHPYYHLCNHPLYSAAHKIFGLVPPATNPSLIQIGVEDTTTDAFSSPINTEKIELPQTIKDKFSSVVYFTQGKVRIAKLRERFDAVAKLAESCEARYKYFFATLIEEDNILRNMTKLQLS